MCKMSLSVLFCMSFAAIAAAWSIKDLRVARAKYGLGGYPYIEEPIAKFTDPTQATDNLIAFTESEFLKRQIIAVGDNIHVAVGYGLGNSIMIEGNT